MTKDGIEVHKDGHLGWIRINRPERLNALAGDMRERIDAGLEELENDHAIRCAVITGVGRAFSTGGDVGVMAELAESGDEERFTELVRLGARIVQRIDEMSTPVIAAVNGPAAGAGACLALACDLRVASSAASIGFTFSRVGLHPDWGGSYFLPRLVGPALAAELIYTGGMIGAERAEQLGLFNIVVAPDALENATRTLAGQIASGPREVITAAKQILRNTLAMPLASVLELETEAQLRAFRSPDFKEGLQAFMEKRTPRFNGK
ncbi:MAG: enoyl-CoA hydratase-related protein [Gemmatimonadota bacterium]|jgi:2-(1,2-epoxy-1,2-dihydrophenyl)acetyl-CoA isomerase